GRRPPGGILVLDDREGSIRDLSSVGRFTTGWQEHAARELVSRFLRRALPTAPPWFREGITPYVETIQMDGGVGYFGGQQLPLHLELRAGRVIPVHELLVAPPAAFHGDWARSHQASAWAFIHFLLEGESGHLRPRFDAIVAGLRTSGRDPQAGLKVV